MILNAAQGERREAPPRKIAAGLWNRKKRGKCFSVPKLQNSGVATGPADYAECFVCKSDFDATISPP
jgi:hypothetical protein